jgi:hypothetical protein
VRTVNTSISQSTWITAVNPQSGTVLGSDW